MLIELKIKLKRTVRGQSLATVDIRDQRQTYKHHSEISSKVFNRSQQHKFSQGKFSAMLYNEADAKSELRISGDQ